MDYTILCMITASCTALFHIHSSLGVSVVRGSVTWHPGFITYRKTCNISRTLVDNKIIDLSDVVGASPVVQGIRQGQPQDSAINLGFGAAYIRDLTVRHFCESLRCIDEYSCSCVHLQIATEGQQGWHLLSY